MPPGLPAADKAVSYTHLDVYKRQGLADAGNIYGRLTNSTQDVFEKRIAALELSLIHI